jgi:hypothetical protein
VLRAIRRTWHLAWDTLVDLYGNEETLRARLDAVKAVASDEDSDLLELTGKYLHGWRPKDFG